MKTFADARYISKEPPFKYGKLYQNLLIEHASGRNIKVQATLDFGSKLAKDKVRIYPNMEAFAKEWDVKCIWEDRGQPLKQRRRKEDD